MGNRLLIIILIISILGVSGTWILVHRGIDRMLEEQAHSEAIGWAEFVKGGLRDINHILRGAPPTLQDLRTLGTAKNVGNVTWFKIYDQDSTIVWSANFREVGEENTSEVFTQYVTKGLNRVLLNHQNENQVMAIAYLPIMENGSFQGAIELTLDLTHAAKISERVAINIVIGVASMFLVLLVITTFFVRSEISKQRKLRLAAEQAAKARNDFIAMVSHELRTPMNGILGALGLLKESQMEGNQKKLTDTAFSSTEHLLAIINDILDFTQVEAHRITLHPHPIQLNNLADEIDVMFRTDAERKNLKFYVIKDFYGIVGGNVDLKRLRQILFNLASNAIKFTDEGEIKIIFRLQGDGDKTKLICEVSDTGIGLSPDDQEIIFKKFRQAEESMSRQYSGVGLGLSVCKELAELMAGSLEVNSQLNEGSHFILTIPFAQCQPAKPKRPESGAEVTDQHSLSILLVEDNDVNQKILSAVLKSAGHSTTIANDGLEAVSQSNETKFDLILMDIQMPKMDGVQATKEIRKSSELNRDTPIIAISANILEDQKETYFSAGMQHCLSKPIKPQDLRQAVIEFHEKFNKKI